jgi:hypothetical protein
MEQDGDKQRADYGNPYRPPLSASRRTVEPIYHAELIDLIKADKRRSAGWLAIFPIGIALGGTFCIAAVGPTAWSTWMTNWQSNLCLYAGLIGLALSVIYAIRAAASSWKLKAWEKAHRPACPESRRR